jgi:hypothetical protein
MVKMGKHLSYRDDLLLNKNIIYRQKAFIHQCPWIGYAPYPDEGTVMAGKGRDRAEYRTPAIIRCRKIRNICMLPDACFFLAKGYNVPTYAES